MIAYYRFLRRQGRRVGFGFSTSFFSSFGQTFFISLFVPFFLVNLDLTAGGFGTLYSLATLGSALLLPFLGALYDRIPLPRYCTFVVIGLGGACLAVGAAWSLWVLIIGLWGLRLCGQGLLSHISMTTMAHTAEGDRGKALGAASLGYPFGEGLLPPLAAVAIVWLGWRQTWFAAAVLCFCFLLPFLFWLSRSLVVPERDEPFKPENKRRGKAAWWLFKDTAFLLVLPSVMALAAISTAIFLYQLPMAEAKGWRPEWIAAAFPVFALARAFTAIAAGSWMDRVGALPLLPLCLLPFAAGLGLLLWAGEGWTIPVYLGLFGVTFGMSGVIKTAVWVELYGTEELGAIRSMLATLMTLGTAASPVVVGVMLDRGVSFGLIIGGSLAVVIGVTLPLIALQFLYRKIRD